MRLSYSAYTYMRFCLDAATVVGDDANRYKLGWADHSTTFTCTARGLPAPDVAWLRSDADYVSEDKIFTITTTAEGDKTSSMLEVAS